MTLLGLLTFITALAGCVGAFIEGRKAGMAGTFIGGFTGVVFGFALWLVIRYGIKLGLRIIGQCQPVFRFILGWIFFAILCYATTGSGNVNEVHMPTLL